MNSDDKRLLEASASGQTDQVLQLIEEHGHQLHKFKDQVSPSYSYSNIFGFIFNLLLSTVTKFARLSLVHMYFVDRGRFRQFELKFLQIVEIFLQN